MKALAVLGGIVGVVTLMVVGAVLNGYALSVLWGWFVVPTFGAPPLLIVPAIGISLVVSYLTHQMPNSKDEDDRAFGQMVAHRTGITIGKPLFALFFGWIIHLFM